MTPPVIDKRRGHFTSRTAAGVSLLAFAVLLVLVVLFFSPVLR